MLEGLKDFPSMRVKRFFLSVKAWRVALFLVPSGDAVRWYDDEDDAKDENLPGVDFPSGLSPVPKEGEEGQE